MSNTSPLYENKNNNVMYSQGGDKKVMKKILSVALSTAMAFSMFASVAFGDTLSTQDKYDALKAKGIFSGYPDGTAGLDKEMTRAEFAKVITKVAGLTEVTGIHSYKDAGYDNPKNWAAPYIEAVTVAGIMEGTDLTKKLFEQKKNVSVEELAKILVNAMKLEVPVTGDNTASEWAKGYVAAAIKAGFISKDLNFQADAKRSLLVEAAFAAEAALNVTTATKVASVSASNLKEVVVTFDGTVDAESAEEVSNYTLKSGKVIKSVILADDQKSATINLESTLANNKVDALTVANVKAGDKVISANLFEFTTVDNVLPVVESIKSLGTKSVKVVFSEPINDLKQSNFTLDGKEYYGKVDLGANNRSAILTPYSATALAVGDHKLVVTGVKDYANFISLSSTHEFTVVEDKDAPTITEATATLETVTITFSEDVDDATVSASNVFWKSGTDKKTADSKLRLADNKYKFFFDAEKKSLPTGSVAVFVENVKDYSGNTIASGTSVIVTPVIDQVRPEVAKVTAVTYDQIKVVFTKPLLAASARDTKNYTVTNKDGKVISVQSADIDPTNSKAVLVNLYSKLSAGNNTIAIKNVKDNTKLQNTMLDFSGAVLSSDVDAPKISSSLVNVNDRRVVIKFDKVMDVESLTNYSNYVVTINGSQQVLNTTNADISPMQDATAVSITLAETINGKITKFAPLSGNSSTANVSHLQVLGLKDAAGNYLQEFTEQTEGRIIETHANTVFETKRFSNDYAANKVAKLVDQKTLQIKFSAGINQVNSGALVVNKDGVAQTINSIDVDGSNVVTINLANDLPTDGDLVTVAVDFNRMTTIAGDRAHGVDNRIIGTSEIQDAVAPKVMTEGLYTTVSGATYESITIAYSEVLRDSGSVLLNNSDYKITRISDNKVLDAATDYAVIVNGSKVVTIELHDNVDRKKPTAYRVEVKDAKRVKDLAGNVIADSDKDTVVVPVRP
ncbi:S-layer homology domain-containing protein [Paenibacillus sp. FA6]|uniref:S-layer homology domain-containing protein n=1 Tax=Paenibacillus sp. FA6 TaxID=3413029 RepID=UPI003F65E2AD